MNKKPDAVDIHVGQRLEQARLERHVTQQQLGDALGVTFQQVQKYLHGSNRISAGKLYEASKFLNVDVGYFFIGLDDSADERLQNDPYTVIEKAAERLPDPVIRDALLALISRLRP